MVSTDGYTLNSVNSALASSKRIKYAGISFSPYEHRYHNTTEMRRTMVHEIGHALGLGHPNDDFYPTSADSVMRQGYSGETYYIPRTHDLNDLSNKY